MSADQPLVLFLGPQNTAISLLAEAYLLHASGGRFRAISAGVNPGQGAHPAVLSVLDLAGITVPPLSSVGIAELSRTLTEPVDLVIVLSEDLFDQKEAWDLPGDPLWQVWSVAKVDLVADTETVMFQLTDILGSIRTKIDSFLGLPG